MEPRECFYQDRFGYCWLHKDQWYFQAVDEDEQNVADPIKVGPEEVMFEHDGGGQEAAIPPFAKGEALRDAPCQPTTPKPRMIERGKPGPQPCPP